MVGTLSAQVGLLVFAVSIVAGLQAGNTVTTILTRAMIAMMLGVTIAQFAAWTAKLILRDHLQRRKMQIDLAHVEAVRASRAETDDESERQTQALPTESIAESTS